MLQAARCLVRAMLVSVVGLGALAGPAMAQSGTIAGAVKDTTGALLPGVTVEASSPALIEQVRSTVTDASGEYKVVDLRPGTYTVRFSLTGFVLRIVDAVDRCRLCIAGSRRHGEIGIAAGLQQDWNLVINAAPLTVAARIAKRPVSVDEPVHDFVRHRILSQNAVTVVQGLPKRVKLFFQTLRRVVVVVQVNVDFSETFFTQFSEDIEIFRAVLILWIKERMSRRSTVDITKLFKQSRV